LKAPNIAEFFCRIARKKKTVIFTAALIVIFSILGITRIVIDNVFVEYFKASADISQSDRFIREKFGGSKIVSVVARADSTESLLMPDVLGAMDDLSLYLEEEIPEAGKVIGFTDLIKRINQVFNASESPDGLRSTGTGFDNESAFGFESFGFSDFGFGGFGFEDFEPDFDFNEDEPASFEETERFIDDDGRAYYEIPRDPARYGKTRLEELSQLVANYLILLSGNISSYANDPLSPTAIKTTVQLRTLGDADTGKVIESISRYVTENFPLAVETIIGGTALIEASLNRLVVESQLISIIVSVLIVFFIVTFSNRSLIAGMVGIAPLSICILINFAVMGFLGIKLNIGTSMVAAVSVGIGIDYTIHYMEAYKREYLAAKGKGDFLPKTFAASGKAIIINAASVGAGFAVLIFSQFIMLRHLGFLIALCMISSALVSLTVIPVLLSTLNPKFVRKAIKEVS
ncbi:MAG: MMPL family transporter, partial [Treponema sp.]|jgi:predicted RND superfamily exporter protein|nr:MMPL family transporter [Treponema sp.]